MSRPRKTAKRDVIRPARFTADEWRAVCESAELAELSPCSYLREAALQHRLRTRVDKKALYHLGRIGNNLNQLARVANTTGRLAAAARLETTLEDVRAAIRRLV